MRRVITTVMALLGILGAVFIAAGPAEALSCTSTPYGNLTPKLDVNHQYSIGPYTHGVVWEEPGALWMHRWLLYTMYPSTQWTLVEDVSQALQPGVWYGIYYTPYYRPGDGRYWKIVLWDPGDGSGYRCESNVVYN